MVQIPGSNIRTDINKKDKDDVNYRHYEKCSLCIYYLQDKTCRLVHGNIAEETICDLYSLKEDVGPHNKEYFERIYKGGK